MTLTIKGFIRMICTILVIVEHKEARIKKVSEEILGYCSLLSAERGCCVKALVYGDKVESSVFEQIGSRGVKDIIFIKDKQLARHHPYLMVPVITGVIKRIQPQLVLFGNTPRGIDLAPRVAQRFYGYMASDVVGFEIENDRVSFCRYVYGQRVFETVNVRKYPVFATVRPNTISWANVPLEKPEVKCYTSEQHDLGTYVVKEVVTKTIKEIGLNEAEIVVAGGRGIKKAEDFSMLEDLARVLKGAVGASRGAVDAGLRPYSAQIGQTGQTISPRLYIACGISGAMQHTAGISAAQVIVAINSDPGAPIFKTADYCIVGDLYQIVPLLTREFCNRLNTI